MDVIFSTDNLPKRRLIVQQTLANRFAAGVGDQISIMRRQLAMQIAEKCMECDDLTEIVIDGPFIKVQADCIIMTQNELAELMRKQFRAGLDHARDRMMPSIYEKGGA